MNTGRRRRCRPAVYPSADSRRRRQASTLQISAGRQSACRGPAAVGLQGPVVCMQGPCCSLHAGALLQLPPPTPALADRLQLQQVASFWPLKVSVTCSAAIVYNFISAALIHHNFCSIYLLHHACSIYLLHHACRTCLHYHTCSTCLCTLVAAIVYTTISAVLTSTTPAAPIADLH